MSRTQTLEPLVAGGPRTRRPRRRVRGRLAGILFVTPATALVVALFVVPLLLAAWMSVNDWPLIGPAHFNGLANYREIPGNQEFLSSALFTLKYTVITTVVLTALAFGLALLVQQRRRGSGALRTAYFLPAMIGLAIASLLWYALSNQQVGAFSAVLRAIGVAHAPVDFLGTPTRALGSTVALITWKYAGFQMLILLVGLQSIDPQLYEAARIDGAGRWQLMRWITLPLLRPTLALLLILSITGSLLAFDQFFVYTSGGPDNATITMVFAIYREAFVRFNLGAASALAIALLLVLVVMNTVQLTILRRREA
jgi:multiple sugar transport system permease protein